MNKLPCEECVKTDNHCCKADIPLEPTTALSLIGIAREAGITNLGMNEHPKFESRVIIFNKDWVEDGHLDLVGKDCAFLVDGKCAIYENRPDICRLYGTKWIRCRWEAGGVNSQAQISRATREDIEYYDSIAGEKSQIKKELEMIR